MLDGMAKSLILQHVKEHINRSLKVCLMLCLRMRPDLLLLERLSGAGPLNLDSLEQAIERPR